MKRKVFLSIFLSSVFTLILTMCLTITVMHSNYSNELKNEIKTEALYICDAIEMLADDDNAAENYLDVTGKSSENRITYISSDGTVLYDNYISASKLDNHGQRPEVADALNNGYGEITRPSTTFGEETYYYALRLDEEDYVLRIACNSKNIAGLIGNTVWLIVIIGLLVVILSLAIAYVLTKSIIKPINQLDLSNPLDNETYEEFAPLLARMAHQNKQIENQIQSLSKSKDEFEYITSNMNEGLVILSNDGMVVSANKSARKTLSDNIDGSYLQLCHNTEYINSVKQALAGNKAECIINKNGRIYNLTVNPVKNDDGTSAAVIFIVDITEKELSDKIRHEFSANVSHELKTPLTSIMGYAEIISNGIAQKNDIPKFAEMIHTESARLLTLIEDIIKLSQLDEEDKLQERFEEIELSEICENVIQELASKAKTSEVSLSFNGNKAIINGFKPVIHEMIYNLCDNSIIYNKKGGKAEIALQNENNQTILTVSDNGIGIPAEHQSRVFERFYRVDKSHSKETGGTGLGLSIVRHGALLHNADIEMTSKSNLGTSIKIIFHK